MTNGVKKEIRLQGIAASPGITMGKVYQLGGDTIEVKQQTLNDGEVQAHVDKFKSALENAKSDLDDLYQKTAASFGEQGAQIFRVHKLMLEDPLVVDKTIETIEQKKINADYAFSQVMELYEKNLQNMDDYFQARTADIRDLKRRVIRAIKGTQASYLRQLTDSVIIFAKELTPSDTMNLDHNLVMGFAMDFGARTSHATILARSIKVPAVVGLNVAQDYLEDDVWVILDGNDGSFIINPSLETIEEYKLKILEFSKIKEKLGKIINLPARTKDGKDIELASNIEFPNEVGAILELHGDGIGLYRTEYLYLADDELPDEEQQYKEYKLLAEKMENKPVIIRTFDLGGDKPPTAFKLMPEANPFLGVRGFRLYRQDCAELFKIQLRAIVRAAVHGKMRIMFPMISCVSEIRYCRDMLDKVKAELKQEGYDVPESLPYGAMIEVPSAAVIADLIADECDFLSIGTNDLIQYTLAVDRGNKNMNYLYQPYNPAVLRLIREIIHKSHARSKWVGMCGEMAGDPLATMILIGMSLDEFSVSPVSHLLIKDIIRRVEYSECENMANKVLSLSTAAEVEDYLRTIYQKKFADLFVNAR